MLNAIGTKQNFKRFFDTRFHKHLNANLSLLGLHQTSKAYVKYMSEGMLRFLGILIYTFETDMAED